MGYLDDMWNEAIDIGSGVRIQYFSVNQGEERAGVFVMHKHPDDEYDDEGRGFCMGSVNFDTPYMQEHFSDKPRWTVVSEDPLTLTPSISQKSGNPMRECLHGYITEGRWVGV